MKRAVEKHPSAALRLSFDIATYRNVRLIPQDFAGLASGCFDQPGKNYFFNNLLANSGQFYLILNGTY